MIKFEIIFISILVILQIAVFVNVWRKIIALKRFFPESFSDIQIKKFKLWKGLLNNNISFNSFLDSLTLEGEKEEPVIEGEIEEVELLVIPEHQRDDFPEFNEVIKSTNAYLSKNKGSSADFNILQDICERHLQKIDNSIGNLINVPLYIGLAGTFIGIIIGLWGIDFTHNGNADVVAISNSSISQLLNGVISAMFASLAGLGFTVWNSALNYKPAVYKNDTYKNEYYDFLQRELLPVLNVGMAGSLTNFKSVLNHFITKFGENIGDYYDSAELLNENLQKQQLVLEEINKLSITRTAVKIAEVFAKLKESSEHLDSFKSFQKGLNDNISLTGKVVGDIINVIQEFKDFNSNLKTISSNVLSSIELQKSFKDSLETHFPTIADHRVVWRKQVDELNEDVKKVYETLNEHFKKSSEFIQLMVSENQDFFHGLDKIYNNINVFKENSILMNEQFTVLKSEISQLRKDNTDSQKASYELNKDLLEAIKNFTLTVSKLENTIKNKN